MDQIIGQNVVAIRLLDSVHGAVGGANGFLIHTVVGITGNDRGSRSYSCQTKRLLKIGQPFSKAVSQSATETYSFPNVSRAVSRLSYMGMFCRKPVMPSTL